MSLLEPCGRGERTGVQRCEGELAVREFLVPLREQGVTAVRRSPGRQDSGMTCCRGYVPRPLTYTSFGLYRRTIKATGVFCSLSVVVKYIQMKATILTGFDYAVQQYYIFFVV